MQYSENEYSVKRTKGLGRNYQLVDIRHKVLYNFREKKFSIGKKMIITDAAGNELGHIRRGFALILPQYRITLNGTETQVITVTRKFSLQVGYNFSGISWLMECNYTGGRSRVTDAGGETVMEMECAYNSWSDRYYLQVNRSADLLTCCCIAVAIDAVNEDLSKAHQS